MLARAVPAMQSIESVRLKLCSGYPEGEAATDIVTKSLAPDSWRVIHKEHHVLIGECRIRRLHRSPQAASLGGYLSESYRGTGLAREAAHLCLLQGFGQMGLDRIVAVTRASNLPAVRVLQSIGMEYQASIPCVWGTLLLYSVSSESWKA